ncbi:excalibur calcium-binding domain-containing protein [uncultured Martelella sp.]|uniref:excalibur calcium-binding domain-containing protein n=1 Tax=uncultured Martelella sp. TaxID=392331 RepID=UPI0029C7FFD3|nr:excalibur calcium-binding domain-containing protein [uncultured Martelella sp.]
MRRLHGLVFFTLLIVAGGPVAVESRMPAPMSPAVLPVVPVVPVAGWTCGQASSCAEAVQHWCGGYRRADGDSDGIPCENVCKSRIEVNRIRSRIGC